jgi:hypothetical protein
LANCQAAFSPNKIRATAIVAPRPVESWLHGHLPALQRRELALPFDRGEGARGEPMTDVLLAKARALPPLFGGPGLNKRPRAYNFRSVSDTRPYS